MLAKTSYPSSMSDRARNEVPVIVSFWNNLRKGSLEEYLQTSVVIPAMIICFFPVALTAALNSSLSQASTSPFRLMKGALGCIYYY